MEKLTMATPKPVLLAAAKDRDINLPPKAKKKEILDLINENQPNSQIGEENPGEH